MNVTPQCRTCLAFRGSGMKGTCHLHPPTVMFAGIAPGSQVLGVGSVQPQPMFVSANPTVSADGWCLHWQPNAELQQQMAPERQNYQPKEGEGQ